MDLKVKADFFSALKGLSKKDKLHYMKNCPEKALEALCEACFNLLKHEKLKNKKSVQRKIFPIQESIKKLSKKSLNPRKKRALLNDSKVICGLTSAIGENVLPLLISIARQNEVKKGIKNKSKKNKSTKKK